nr:MAG TPA: hypothetical protein [Caudoviricetes sp.]
MQKVKPRKTCKVLKHNLASTINQKLYEYVFRNNM